MTRARDWLGGLMIGAAIAGWILAITPPHQQAAVWQVVAIAAPVSVIANTVVHELGHLLCAWAVRLPVRGMRLFGRTIFGRATPGAARSHVTVIVERSGGRMPAVRFSLFAAAGPAANLGVAAVALPLALDHARPLVERSAAVSAVVVGVEMGLRNLLPLPTRHGGHRDGRQIVRALSRAGG